MPAEKYFLNLKFIYIIKIRIILCLFVVLLLTTTHLNAQLATKIPFEIKLKSFSFNKVGSFLGDLLGNKVTPVYKFYRDSMIFSQSLHPNLCYFVTAKDKSQVFTIIEQNTFGGPLIMNSNVDLNLNKEIILLMENYQNDKGEICAFDKGDAKHKVTSYAINIATLKHGITQQPVTIKSDQNQYSATFTYCLGLPVPSSPICNSLRRYNDGTKSYILKTNLNLINKDGIQLEWQGSIDDTTWFPLGEKSNKEEITIIPEKDITKSLIRESSKCFLRYRILSPEITSEWAKKSFDIVPPRPFVKKDNILTSNSCSEIATGKINVKLIEGQTNKYRVILFKGKDKVGINCFEDTSLACPESFKDTIINNSTVEFGNLTSGDYTFFIGNANIVSDLYSRNSALVEAYPKLRITTYTPIPANCSVNPSGCINIETNGGNPDSLAFMITPIAGEVMRNGRKALFVKLPEGKYNILIKDACDQVVLTPVILIEVKNDSLMANIVGSKKSGFNKSDGSLTIKVENGSGLYSYKLFLKDNLMISKDFSGAELILDNLYAVKYEIQISDKNAPKCTGWTKEFLIEQLPPSSPPSIITDTIR
jgi:hypothetical protein